MKLPDAQHTTASMIDAYHEEREDKPRPHLGCSTLGHHCDRWLWLSFRWAVREKFSGRMLRLFRRGQNEEDIIVSDLRAIGIDIRFTGKTQRRVDFGCHVSGSLDGVIESGVPEAPKARHIAEFKTHSKKSFEVLVKDGVEKSKPMHYAQMQVYMHGTDISRALYVAVCKDDDRLHIERVRYDKAAAEKLVERGKRLALDDRCPPPISTDPSWYQCKFCPAHGLCHERQPTKFANCRTCAHATAKPDSSWRCERHEADAIPYEFQLEGCDDHVLHPDLVPWSMEPSEDGLHVTWTIGDRRIVNGPDGYKSREIVANPMGCGDPFVEEAKSIFPGAEVVG